MNVGILAHYPFLAGAMTPEVPLLSRCTHLTCTSVYVCVQSRAYDNILSSYYGVELSAGGGYDDEAALAEETELFNSGQPSKLGFTKAQINGIWAPPLGIWRVMSWIFDIVRAVLLLCCHCAVY